MYAPGTQVCITADENGAPVGTVVTVTDLSEFIPEIWQDRMSATHVSYEWNGYGGWLASIHSVEPV